MEITISPEAFVAASSFVSAVAYLLDAIHRRRSSAPLPCCLTAPVVAVSVNHGLAGTDVVVRVSSDLNKSSRDLCS